MDGNKFRDYSLFSSSDGSIKKVYWHSILPYADFTLALL